MRFVRISSLIAIAAALLSGGALFWTSEHSQVAEKDLSRLRAKLAHEKKSTHVLRAEWDYLNRPERIEALAARYLNMKAPEIEQLGSDAESLPVTQPALTPARKPAIPVSTKPVISAPAKPVAPTAPHAQDTGNNARDFDALLRRIDRENEE